MSKRENLGKAAVAMMVLTVLSKVLGLVREMVLSYYYGMSDVSDAFVIANSIPVMLIGIISNGLTTSYIPIYSQVHVDEGRDRADRFTSNLVNIILIIATILVVFGEVFTRPIVRVFAPGFEGATLNMTVEFSRWSILTIYAIAVSSIFRGYLNYYDEFLAPAATGFVLNAILITCIVLSKYTSTRLLGIGLFLGNALQYIIFIRPINKTGYKHMKILDTKSKNVSALVEVAIPVMIGVAVMEINNMADRIFASMISEGAVTGLNYAQKMTGFVSGIVIVSITTAVYPEMSRQAVNNDMDGLKNTTKSSIGMSNLLVFPMAIGIMVLAHPIMDLFFGRGKMTAEGINQASGALLFYGPMLIGQSARDVLNRAFYAIKDMKTPMIVSTIMVVINIILDFILMQNMDISGLALATSIATILGMLGMYIKFRKEVGQFGFKSLLISYVKIGLASVLMGLGVQYIYKAALGLGEFVSLFIAIIAGIIIYLVLIFLFKVDEVEDFMDLIKEKFKKGKKESEGE